MTLWMTGKCLTAPGRDLNSGLYLQRTRAISHPFHNRGDMMNHRCLLTYGE